MKMTALTLAMFCVPTLMGCAITPAGDELPSSLDVESAAVLDAKIATIEVPGGKVIFVDEGLTEPGGGIAFWEIGDVDLSYLLDVQQATALEVFLALSPAGTPVPERLVEHHAEVARRIDTTPTTPRKLDAALTLPTRSSFTSDPLDYDGTDSVNNCWGWAGTTSASSYTPMYGYSGFNDASFQSNFNLNYANTIPGGAGTYTGFGKMNSDNSGPPIQTSAGHLRSMAFCMSKAIDTLPGGGDDCYENGVEVTVFVRRTTDSTYLTTTPADSIVLTAFGQGARFLSNLTNSGGGARKYEVSAAFRAPPGDNTVHCADELVTTWRSRALSPGEIIP